MEHKLDLNGIIPATVTPMEPDAEIDEKQLRGYIRWLVGHKGLKGVAVWAAVVSGLHAKFIENRGGASAAQVLELMDQVRRRVREQFGVELEPEVEVVGDA